MASLQVDEVEEETNYAEEKTQTSSPALTPAQATDLVEPYSVEDEETEDVVKPDEDKDDKPDEDDEEEEEEEKETTAWPVIDEATPEGPIGATELSEEEDEDELT